MDSPKDSETAVLDAACEGYTLNLQTRVAGLSDVEAVDELIRAANTLLRRVLPAEDIVTRVRAMALDRSGRRKDVALCDDILSIVGSE